MGFAQRVMLVRALKLFDLLVMMLVFGLAGLFVVLEVDIHSPAEFLAMRVAVGNFVLFAFLLVLWGLVFSQMGLYQSKRLTTFREEAVEIVGAVSVGTFAIVAVAWIFDIEVISRLFIAVFWSVECLITLLSRLLLRLVLQSVRLVDRNLRYVVIAGTNPRAHSLAEHIASNPQLGYRLVGFVDDVWQGNAGSVAGYETVADFHTFSEYLGKNVIDEVFICLPLRSHYEQSERLVMQCEEQGVTVHFDQDVFSHRATQNDVRKWNDRPWTTLGTGSIGFGGMLAKRTVDIVVSLTALVLLSPLFVTVAILIKKKSPGPIFFAQERIGLNKRRFRLYKFRTMVTNAEQVQAELESANEAHGPVFKIANDPRITPMGRFLRRTSIDELPQLFNVLKGDMTLVGPRPLPVRDYEGFEQSWHRRRLSVLPGITGLWQVEGRSSVSFDQWMELDMKYIDEWSLWLDLKILFKTIPAVFRGSGAY